MPQISPSQRGAPRGRIIAMQRRPRAAIFAERMLSARRFHANAIKWLAKRPNYADAADVLARVAAHGDLIVIFALPPTPEVLVWRLAVICGYLPPSYCRPNTKPHPINIEEVRAKAPESEPARLVLAAALGEIDWSPATRRARAVYCLRALVAARP